MTRTTTGLCIAAAFGFAVSVAAQSTTTDPSQTSRSMRSDKGAHEVTVTGCLARGSDGNYMLNDARMGDSMSDRSRTSSNPTTSTTTTATPPTATTTTPPTTTNPEPTSPEPTGTTGSAAATTANNAMSWKLEGGHDLDKHVGHKVEVKGHTDWNGSSSTSTTTTTTAHDAMSGPRLDVTSVKMISSSCK